MGYIPKRMATTTIYIYQYLKSLETHNSSIWMSVGHSSSTELCDTEMSTFAVATNLKWLVATAFEM